jgi:serine/threonine-protein kinase
VNGDMIGGYRILQPLSRGGRGGRPFAGVVPEAIEEAFAVEHVATRRRFVLLLDPDPPSADELRAFAVAREVDHETLLRPRDLFEHEGRTAKVLEPFEGRALADLLSGRNEPLSLPAAVHYATPIFRALDVLHARGFVHGSVEPSHIFIGPGESARLEWDPLGPMTRSLAFMSPQRLIGERVDGRADVWSMGVVLYFATTGREPFFSPEPREIVLKIARSDAAPPERWRRGYPPELSRLVLDCLRRDPGERPSAAAAARALEDLPR